MDSSTLTALAAAAIFVCVAFLLLGGNGSGPSSKASQRLNSISSRGRAQKKGLFSFLNPEDSSSRRKQIEESLGQIEERQKNKAKTRKTIKSKLTQANWSTTPQAFLLVSLVLFLVAGAIPLALGAPLPFVIGLAVVIGLGMPRWVLNMAIGRRQKKFTAHFADAMDIIVRGVRTGLPLGDCLKIIAHESPEPVRSEFLLVVEGESVGVPIDICLERMFERMPLSEVNFFATVLNIQKSTGGNLGESLANLSAVLRGRKLLREKIKALSAEAKMSAYVIGSLPIIVMILVTIASPDYMSELYTTPTGHRNLMIGAGMMVFGTLTMKKMINFKF